MPAEERSSCPVVDFDYVNLRNGHRTPGSCHVYRCEHCGPTKAYAYGQLAAGSRPERFVTLTLAPPEWQECRDRMRTFVQRVRRDGYQWQAFWAVEPNPKGTGFHVHAVQHGDYVPQAFLQDAWGAITHIEAIKVEQEGQGRAARYVIKGTAAANYVVKGRVDDLAAHLDRNGHRTAHWSRRYFRFDTGEPASANALRLALHEAPDPGPWAMVPRDTTPYTVDQLRRLHAGAVAKSHGHGTHGTPAHWPPRPRPFDCGCYEPNEPDP